MEKFFILQVCINFLQQKMTTLQSTHTQVFQNIAKDIITLSHDVLSRNNNTHHFTHKRITLPFINNKQPNYNY